MRRYLCTAALLLLLPAPAHGQSSFDSLKTLWTNKHYARVIKPLVELRATAKPEEQLTIDYMIATSHCRLPNPSQRAKGRLAFDAMLLYHYRALSLAQQEQLMAERAKCGPTQPPNSAAVRFVSMNTRRGEARATYNYRGGKQFYDVCRATPDGGGVRNEVAGERPLQGTKTLRVFTRAQLAAARTEVETSMRALGSRGRVRARDGIVVASLGTHTPAQLDTLLSSLVRYRDFYMQEYDLPAPDTVLRVFLAPTQAAMTRLATRLHGFPANNQLIGYSVASDFTIVGIIPRMIYGTLMHELMHVLFHQRYPTAPPWLDEGLAALYEVSRVRGDRVVGIPNWRGQIVHAAIERGGTRGSPEVAYLPTLAELLEMNWTDYEGRRGSPQQATNHALARYFVMYLQDRGKLPDVVRAVVARPALQYRVQGDSISVVAADRGQLVPAISAALRLAPAELQADFDAWLGMVIREGWAPCR